MSKQKRDLPEINFIAKLAVAYYMATSLESDNNPVYITVQFNMTSFHARGRHVDLWS